MNLKKSGEGIGMGILRLVYDKAHRLRVTLALGLVFNLAYLLFNLAPALMYGSVWALSSTVYYVILIVLRSMIIMRANRPNSLENGYRTVLDVGVFLLFLDVAVIFMIAYTASRGRVLPYSPYFVIGYAIFTAYSLAISLVGILNSLRRDIPLHFAARNLTLTAAIASTYSLQHSVLTSSGAPDSLVRIFGIVTATVVSVAVIGVAAAMIFVALSRIGTNSAPNPHKKPRSGV